MALLSSKTLIKAHAWGLFILAVYLMRSPEFITDSDIVFMLGEVLRIVQYPRCFSHDQFLANTTSLSNRMQPHRCRAHNPPSPPAAFS